MCTSCGTNCKTCSITEGCTECNTGFYPSTPATCVACATMTGCSECSGATRGVVRGVRHAATRMPPLPPHLLPLQHGGSPPARAPAPGGGGRGRGRRRRDVAAHAAAAPRAIGADAGVGDRCRWMVPGNCGPGPLAAPRPPVNGPLPSAAERYHLFEKCADGRGDI